MLFLRSSLKAPTFGLCLLFLQAYPAAAEDWTQWGGPNRNFVAAEAKLATEWPEAGPPEIWSHPLSGGYAGVLVEKDRVYVATRRGEKDLILALDTGNGKVVWEHATAETPPFESQVKEFGVGPNATPLIFGDRLFLVGFTGHFYALDKQTGKLHWSKNLVEELGAQIHRFGYSNSPVIYDEKVVILVGGEQVGAVGFDPATGKIEWRTPPIAISYSSPKIFKIGGHDQLVFMGPEEVVGTKLSDGSVSWRHPHKNRFSNNCAGPWWDGEELMFLSSQADGGARALRLSSTNEAVKVQEISSSKKVKIFHSNGLRLDKHLYASYDQFLAAHDLRTSETVWKERGFPNANLIQSGQTTIALDENGNLSLLSLRPEGLEVHAKHQVLSKPSWTPPTLVGSRLYVRNKEKLVVLDLGISSLRESAGRESASRNTARGN